MSARACPVVESAGFDVATIGVATGLIPVVTSEVVGASGTAGAEVAWFLIPVPRKSPVPTTAAQGNRFLIGVIGIVGLYSVYTVMETIFFLRFLIAFPLLHRSP